MQHLLPSASRSISPASMDLGEIDTNGLSDLESVALSFNIEEVDTDNLSDIASVASFKQKMDMRHINRFDVVLHIKHFPGPPPEGNKNLNEFFSEIRKDPNFIHCFKESIRKKTCKYFIESIADYYASRTGAKFYDCKDANGNLEEFIGDKAALLYQRFKHATGIKVAQDII